jgi:hypothetical protein
MGSYGPPPKTFLKFIHVPKIGQKTDRWEIQSHSGEPLGVVRFYPGWRCYVAEANPGTIWSWECDLERSNFTKEQTMLWRQSHKRKIT